MVGGQRQVEDGEFNLFVDESADGTHKRMRYRLPFIDHQGRRLLLIGNKEIRDDPGFDLWSDTTTLFTNIEVAGAEAPIARGEIRIHMLDFLKQLTTFRARGANVAAELAGLGKFGKLFLGSLWQVYAPMAKRHLRDR